MSGGFLVTMGMARLTTGVSKNEMSRAFFSAPFMPQTPPGLRLRRLGIVKSQIPQKPSTRTERSRWGKKGMASYATAPQTTTDRTDCQTKTAFSQSRITERISSDCFFSFSAIFSSSSARTVGSLVSSSSLRNISRSRSRLTTFDGLSSCMSPASSFQSTPFMRAHSASSLMMMGSSDMILPGSDSGGAVFTTKLDRPSPCLPWRGDRVQLLDEAAVKPVAGLATPRSTRAITPA
mmetsp:Transcript_89506/g.255654  ORF Transcript_89506/g.255654 Transcript_89506/m.255654 type:complete len:235 (-) Transcript_89506:41-745(-)